MRAWRPLFLATVAALIVGTSFTASAQDRAVVFVHGLKSSGATWKDAAGRLQTRLVIASSTPSLTWQNTYESQALQLHTALGSLPASAIAIGHSNGGLVAREWSRKRKLGGILTMGTPNSGAPLVYHLNDWIGLNLSAFDLVDAVSVSFGQYDEWSWVFSAVSASLNVATGVAQDSLLLLTGALGLQANVPVLAEMLPGGAYVRAMNASSNLAREATQVAARVGVVNVAANYFRGGVYHAVLPDSANAASDLMHVSAAVLEGYAAQLFASDSLYGIQRGNSLLNVAGWLENHELWWCRTVSDPTPYAYTRSGICADNDTVVPAWSQQYPGAVAVLVRNSPAHIRQTAQSDDLIYQILITYMQVAGRGTGPNPPPPDSNRLAPGQTLSMNQRIASANGRYYLLYQGDGNLVLYDQGGSPMWASRTAGQTVGKLMMQPDGNLVLYNASGSAVWNTGTNRNPGAYAVLTDDGKLVVYSGANAVLWSAPGTTTTPPPPPPPIGSGRYKLDGSGKCYWDPNDTGPNQCTPSSTTTGRYKLDGSGKCYWDANDSGPNQCTP